jgi:hypothetical protein
MNKILLVIVVWEVAKWIVKKIWYYLHNKF